MNTNDSECDMVVRPVGVESDGEMEMEAELSDDGSEGGRGMEAEGRKTKRYQNPRMPSREEIEDHEVAGHLPFRSWCTHCIKGKGQAEAHRQQQKREEGLPEVHLDYAFIGGRSGKEEDRDKLMPVLIVKEKETKMTIASVVPKKVSFSGCSQRQGRHLHQVGPGARD